MNHIVTGYNTVFSDGEMLIAGYELGSGCGSFGIAWVINVGVFTLGLFTRPRSLFRAFVRGKHAESVYNLPDPTALRALTVNDLRAALAIPTDTQRARLRDCAAFAAWSVAALGLSLGGVMLVVAAFRLVA